MYVILLRSYEMDKSEREAGKKRGEALNRARTLELHAIRPYKKQYHNPEDEDSGGLADRVRVRTL